MSLKKVEQVKRDRGFKLFDLIIYGVIVLTVAALFLAVFLTRNTDPLSGVRICVDSVTVFEYEFGKEPTPPADGVEWTETDKTITVTVNKNGGKNVILIDKSAKTAVMHKADCKGGQCLYFGAIDNNNKIIYCNPHRLRVEPLIRNFDSPDIIM